VLSMVPKPASLADHVDHHVVDATAPVSAMALRAVPDLGHRENHIVARASQISSEIQGLKIARANAITLVQAAVLEETGAVPVTQWAETDPRYIQIAANTADPQKAAKKPPALVHSVSHQSGLVAQPRPTLARTFSLKELKVLTQSVQEHYKIATKEEMKADKILVKAEKMMAKGKFDKAEALQKEAKEHKEFAGKHRQAAEVEKALVVPGSTLAGVREHHVVPAGTPSQ